MSHSAAGARSSTPSHLDPCVAPHLSIDYLPSCAHNSHACTLAQEVEAAFKEALRASQQHTVNLFRELRVQDNNAAKSTVMALAPIFLPAGKSGQDVRTWLEVMALARADNYNVHLDPRIAQDALTAALTTSPAELLVANRQTVVLSTTNIKGKSSQEVKDAHALMIRVLEAARAKRGMVRLRNHRQPEDNVKVPSVDKQHKNQVNHAEPIVIGLAMQGSSEVYGRLHWDTPTGEPLNMNPRVQPVCLLLLGSRYCCASCRYALPFIACMLKADIIVQSLKADRTLSSPTLYKWDAPLPDKQDDPPVTRRSP
jgi:hypothetical protein